MQFSALETQNLHFYAPRYRLLVGGKDLVGEGAEIVSLSIDEALDAASRVSFSVLNHDLRWLRSALLAPGAEVELALGYAEPLETLFVGEISELRPTFPSDGAAQLEVSGHDFSQRLGRGCRFRLWENVTDSDIARQIANDHHLDPSGVKTTKGPHPKVMQNGESDLEFLKARAEKHKFEVAVRGRMLVFAEPQDQASSPEITTLKWGESLISFSPELNTTGPVSEVSVRGWNPAAKQEIVGKATWKDVWGNQPDRQSGGELVEHLYGPVEECIRGEPVYTQEEAAERARAILKERADTFIQGSGELIGMPQIRAGSSIILDGLGPFSMKYYITATTHSLSASGYRTTLRVKGDTYARPR
jgi:uncharacterized protein